MTETKDKLIKAIVNLTEVENEIVEIIDREQEIDLRISDLLHYIEFNSLSTGGSYSIMRELKKLRNERRKIKDINAMYRIYLKNIGKLKNKDNRQFLISDVSQKVKSLNNQIYANRIYTEEELNKIAKKEKR